MCNAVETRDFGKNPRSAPLQEPLIEPLNVDTLDTSNA